MKFIKDLKTIDKKDVSNAGGKGANLGEMMRIGIPVPPGFIVLAPAFERFSTKTKIPRDLEKEILDAFQGLKTKYVAVRSSATAEDSRTDSWAGVLETYLNTTEKNLIQNVKKCWDSLASPRALLYRRERGLKNKKVKMAVIVQKMVQSEVSGVCFTVQPVTKNRNQIVIEAVRGLGEALVQGQVTPDSYVIAKDNLKILDSNIPSGEKQKLAEKKIKELAKLCIKIEDHYKNPQDIEWAFSKNKFYIVQSRPITA